MQKLEYIRFAADEYVANNDVDDDVGDYVTLHVIWKAVDSVLWKFSIHLKCMSVGWM